MVQISQIPGNVDTWFHRVWQRQARPGQRPGIRRICRCHTKLNHADLYKIIYNEKERL